MFPRCKWIIYVLYMISIHPIQKAFYQNQKSILVTSTESLSHALARWCEQGAATTRRHRSFNVISITSMYDTWSCMFQKMNIRINEMSKSWIYDEIFKSSISHWRLKSDPIFQSNLLVSFWGPFATLVNRGAMSRNTISELVLVLLFNMFLKMCSNMFFKMYISRIKMYQDVGFRDAISLPLACHVPLHVRS